MHGHFHPDELRILHGPGGGRWTTGGSSGMEAKVAEHAPHVKVQTSGRSPMSDAQFAERAAHVEAAIGEARKTHATELTHTLPGGGWQPERDRLHRDVAETIYQANAHVPNDGKAVIAGGLGGAGKTTVLTGHAGIDPKQFLTINPDDIKGELIKRGAVPDVPGHPDLSPWERAALIHEESSRIANLIADRAYRERKNVMWDITMSSQSSVEKRLRDIHNHGYSHTTGVFVDIPTEVSVTRAMARYRRGADDHLAGKGHGGRFVPPSVIRAQQTRSGQTINRGVFDQLRGHFDDWSVFDNSVDGRAPELIAKKG